MEHCPWSGWRPATIHFCERELCSWITQPANTWSNLAYIVVGSLIIHLAVKEQAFRLIWIGIIGILVGIGSFFFHASSSFAGEVVDVGAMFLFANFALIVNLRRWKGLDWKLLIYLFALMMATSLTLLITIGWVGILVFTLQVVAAGLVEIAVYRRDRKQYSYKWLALLSAFFTAALTIWALDRRGIVCDPDNHILQGHAAWHLLNSLCFYCLYQFYKPWLKNGRL